MALLLKFNDCNGIFSETKVHCSFPISQLSDDCFCVIAVMLHYLILCYVIIVGKLEERVFQCFWSVVAVETLDVEFASSRNTSFWKPFTSVIR